MHNGVVTCAECGQPARFAVEHEGETRQLCERCVDRASGMVGLTRFMDGFRRPRRTAIDQCPHCGTTADSISETGSAGCPLCYEAMGDVWKRFGIVQGAFERTE